jgi:hypothetical protein
VVISAARRGDGWIVRPSLPIEMAVPADVRVGSLRHEDGALLIEPFSGALRAS